MWQRRKTDLDKRLDRAAQRVLAASVLPELEARNVTSSPFLYSGVRRRIQNESQKQGSDTWSSLIVSWQTAMPAMALAAAVSLGLFLYINGNKAPTPVFSVDAYLRGDSDIDNLLFAERRSFTNEEVLADIVSTDEAAK